MANKEVKEPAPAKKFYRVRFHERTGTNEPVNVVLGINGNVLVIKRGEEVILPEDYVTLARSCVISYTYPALDGSKNVRKRITRPRCPFDLLGEATEEEFLKMKKEGTEQTLASIKKKIEEEG